ncbi:hypothetical protein NQ117_05330 [Paenibacillus sp. SC116]|uniref:hypothetical protein n=1 Tax=Paenibacillus sp. SC116 TaxID=2968986 RepID=UPI00215B6444|nr:hypothetical protein [Paenibacillus sp. SC116]MCR8843094.1 hypothetical protein [Paenibacillus sp. SC116]
MKAVVKGFDVTGTPDEIAALITRLSSEEKKPEVNVIKRPFSITRDGVIGSSITYGHTY